MAKSATFKGSNDGGGDGKGSGTSAAATKSSNGGNSRNVTSGGEAPAKKAEKDEEDQEEGQAKEEEEEEEDDEGDAEMQDQEDEADVAKSSTATDEDARVAAAGGGEDSDDFVESGAAATLLVDAGETRTNPMANAVPGMSFFDDYPWLSGNGGSSNGSSSSRSGAMVPSSSGGYAVGLSGSGSYTSCVHRHFVLPIPTEEDETYLVVKRVVEERTRAAIATEKALHLERTVERLKLAAADTNRRAETAKSDAAEAVREVEVATAKWKDLVRRRDVDLSTAEEQHNAQMRELEEQSKVQLDSQIKSLEQKAAVAAAAITTTSRKSKETAVAASAENAPKSLEPTEKEVSKKRKKTELPDASTSAKTEDSTLPNTPDAKRSRVAGAKSPNMSTTVEPLKDAAAAASASGAISKLHSPPRRQSSDFMGWGASAAEIASTEASASTAAGANATKSSEPGQDEGTHRRSITEDAASSGATEKRPAPPSSEPGEVESAPVASTGEVPLSKKEKKKKKKKKKEAARRADLEKVEADLNDLNRTKSQMIWLLKQVITAEKTRKSENDKAKTSSDAETANSSGATATTNTTTNNNNKTESKKS